MSKTTTKLQYGSITAYLKQLVTNNSWSEMWPAHIQHTTKAPVTIDDNGGITIYGAECGRFGESLSPKVYICVKLIPSAIKPVFLVERFEIFTAEEEISSKSEEMLFGHYNMRVATKRDTQKEDLKGLWTITCAKDLEALFRAYDNLARFYRRPVMFNLP